MGIVELIWPIILIEIQLLVLVGWDYAVDYEVKQDLIKLLNESIRHSK
jgi:hypothetical protein